MATAEQTLPKARRYGETKRGPNSLRFFKGTPGIRIEASDGVRVVGADLRDSEVRDLTRDEATARACEIIDKVLFDVRDAARRKVGN